MWWPVLKVLAGVVVAVGMVWALRGPRRDGRCSNCACSQVRGGTCPSEDGPAAGCPWYRPIEKDT